MFDKKLPVSKDDRLFGGFWLRCVRGEPFLEHAQAPPFVFAYSVPLSVSARRWRRGFIAAELDRGDHPRALLSL